MRARTPGSTPTNTGTGTPWPTELAPSTKPPSRSSREPLGLACDRRHTGASSSVTRRRSEQRHLAVQIPPPLGEARDIETGSGPAGLSAKLEPPSQLAPGEPAKGSGDVRAVPIGGDAVPAVREERSHRGQRRH